MNSSCDIGNPIYNRSIPAPKVDSFEFNDTFESEDGTNTVFYAKGEYCSDPDSFGYIVESIEVTCLDWTNEHPEVIREAVREAMLAHFNCKKITYNCNIELI